VQKRTQKIEAAEKQFQTIVEEIICLRLRKVKWRVADLKKPPTTIILIHITSYFLKLPEPRDDCVIYLFRARPHTFHTHKRETQNLIFTQAHI
jgi:hypothetical protein